MSGDSSAGLKISVTGAEGPFSKQIEEAARSALKSQRYKKGTLHIAVIGGAEMGRQHARWKNDPTPTDVLTFDLRDSMKKGLVDGELLVCSTVAKREAKRRRGDWRRNSCSMSFTDACTFVDTMIM
ncbi:MAG: rRNA maturation RNAse YbeY [Planctomycetes bacterium]|nr:rRNA maturation RNAse YbeY [Planctomycetota bacterium]